MASKIIVKGELNLPVTVQEGANPEEQKFHLPVTLKELNLPIALPDRANQEEKQSTLTVAVPKDVKLVEREFKLPITFQDSVDLKEKTVDLPITLQDGVELTKEQLRNYYPFMNWAKTLLHSISLQTADESHPFYKEPYSLRSVEIQAVDRFPKTASAPERIGFIKLLADLSYVEDDVVKSSLPGYIFLRGPAVAMLMIVIPDYVDEKDADEERRVILVVQPRVAVGSLDFTEIPAGMVDEENNFGGTAAREIQEELGITISADQLTCLSDVAFELYKKSPAAQAKEEAKAERLPGMMFPSTGACDEYIRIYMHERKVSREQLDEWNGKCTGLRDEGEKITLKIAKMKNLWLEGLRDAKALAALALWENLKKEGALKGFFGCGEKVSEASEKQ